MPYYLRKIKGTIEQRQPSQTCLNNYLVKTESPSKQSLASSMDDILKGS